MYLQSRDKERRRPENASTCSECQGGGELVCCDSCTRSFHVGCLERALEPQNDCDRWFCPACRDFKSNVLAKIGALPTSPDHPSEIVTSSDHASDNDEKRHLPRRSTRKTDETRKETKGIVSEGSWDASAKINVGSAFQVAHMPRFYLEAEESGISYDKSPTHSRGVISTRLRRGLSECQVAYSPVLLRRSWMSLSERAQQDRCGIQRETSFSESVLQAGGVGLARGARALSLPFGFPFQDPALL